MCYDYVTMGLGDTNPSLGHLRKKVCVLEIMNHQKPMVQISSQSIEYLEIDSFKDNNISLVEGQQYIPKKGQQFKQLYFQNGARYETGISSINKRFY